MHRISREAGARLEPRPWERIALNLTDVPHVHLPHYSATGRTFLFGTTRTGVARLASYTTIFFVIMQKVAVHSVACSSRYLSLSQYPTAARHLAKAVVFVCKSDHASYAAQSCSIGRTRHRMVVSHYGHLSHLSLPSNTALVSVASLRLNINDPLF
jgi:hypothetical protein